MTSATVQSLLDSVNTSSSNKKKASVTDDAQTRFLTLLTTQLKNQDPLNPMDNAQMTSQLAQISTVDGIEKLNATLQKLVNGSVDSQAMQAAGMVGHQVMVAGNGLTLTDKGAVGGIELGSSADSVVITVKDSSGLVVKTINMGDLDPGIHNFVWDGATDAGGQAVNGNYSLTVAALRSGEKINATTLQLAQVVGVNRSTQGISLDLGALGPAVMSDIKQIF